MRRRTQLCCCGCGLLFASVARVAVPLFCVLLYTFADMVHDGVSWKAALSDLNYILDAVLKLHPWFGYYSKDRLLVEESDDQVTAICKAALYLKITEVPGHWPIVDSADPGRTLERLEAFVDSCRAVYAELPADGQQRKLLDDYRPPPGIPAEIRNVTSPTMHGPLAPEDVEDFLRRRAADADARPSLESRWEPGRGLTKTGEGPRARPVRPEVVRGAAGIADAVWRGKVAVFDATEILPKEVFNMTMGDIARAHGEGAASIPIYRQRALASLRSGWESLASFANRQDKLGKAGKLYYNSVVPRPRDPSFRPPALPASAPWWLRWAHALAGFALRQLPASAGGGFKPEEAAHELRRELHMTTVNSRRLPKLPLDLESALEHPSWLFRAQPLLWSGAVASWWHNDEPDNLLIGMNGEMSVAVFEASDTDFISGARGPVHHDRHFDLAGFHPDEPDSEWVRQNPWIQKLPYIHVRLKPGMGVVVPSRAYHAIWSEDADRLLLNCFMTPKYKAMEDSPAGAFSYFGRGMQADLYMALFHLKMASVALLWDTKRLGGFFEMVKLESL